ncbi:ubiquinol-cytochrome-c reductase complex assembly factor 3 [Genypterus blacodes]|uniref:ubiquinol-cytochrome-c reductase complex assembly factor 3 n=1 Tax=Genypterus blacodes TaxID=154954 RepID=UPI003F767297
MSSARTVLLTAGAAAYVALGYGLWAAIAPGEERQKEMLKDLPEANPLRMAETRKRNALVMQVLKEAAETNDNVARGFKGVSK